MIRYPAVVFRMLYWYLNKLDKQKQLTFMNFGYAEPGEEIRLDPEFEKNRYPVQLYHHLCQLAEIENKDLVEVGSGRGGGLAYLAKTRSPASAIGIDLVKSFVPGILQKDILNFSGAKGTDTYNTFLTRKFIYRTFKLQKPIA